MKINIIIIDSSLAASYHRGHPEHFVSGFVESCASRGYQAKVICHQNHFGAFSCAAPVIPALSASLHERWSSDSYDGALDDFQTFENRFLEDLLASGESVCPGDLVFLPTASARELAGLGKWLYHLETSVRVAAIFHWGSAHALEPGSLDAALMRRASRRIATASPLNVWYRATRNELARALSGPLGQQVDLVTSLTFFGTASSEARKNKLKRIGILGGARREKGEDIVPDLIRLSTAVHQDIEFVVQDHRLSRDDPSGLAMESPRVTLLRGWLDEDEMHRVCGTLDLAVLPYERQFYSQAVSGVFTLMTAFGVPCIVPSETWMSSRIEEGEAAGVVYRGDSAEAVNIAVGEAMNKLDQLKGLSMGKAQLWRSRYSPESWIGDLLKEKA
ncbi:hypothetical protein [Dyella sp.]|uniref:hypothetical protein n=1 Tax=Dyella sp. TaxID=1869338 RepID=UPI002FD8841A